MSSPSPTPALYASLKARLEAVDADIGEALELLLRAEQRLGTASEGEHWRLTVMVQAAIQSTARAHEALMTEINEVV